MKRFLPYIIISSLLFFNTSCGKKGPIYPPLISFPQKIKEFNAIQIGDKILLKWVNPSVYTDGSPMEEIDVVEIWLAKEEREPGAESKHFKQVKISEVKFLEKAKLVATIAGKELSQYRAKEEEGSASFQYFFSLEDEDFSSKKYVFGLRIGDKKNRKSAFSKFLALEPIILPSPPRSVEASVHMDRVEIKWDPPQTNFNGSSPASIKGYNVYRMEKNGSPRLLNSELLKDSTYEDKNFVFGKKYYYFVRASGTEAPPYFQSSNSEIIEVFAEDTFPPDRPQGLVLIRGETFISLSWDMNEEKDLAGYRVWRKEEGEGEFRLLTPEPILENTFTDSEVEKNKKYIYSITALDQNGNESERSKTVSEIIKESVS